ncbi:MAG: glycosyltransferase family 2 protein [Oscillospiraceae bacterium]|nr:glycosyltransferase family 2 protein [Oscillospiraceae bacterium]
MKKICIAASCYNESANIMTLYNEILKQIEKNNNYKWEILFEDNCSTDNTVEILRSIASKDKRVKVILNQANYGPDRSVMNVIFSSDADAVIAMASDLEDPPELIPEFVTAWEEGYKVAWGQYTSRNENLILKFFRKIYYKIIAAFSDLKTENNVTGFGIYDKSVIDTIRKLGDYIVVFRYICLELGYDVKYIPFNKPARKTGKSSYSLLKYYNYAIETLVLTSHAPLHLASTVGFIMLLGSLLVALYYMIQKFMHWYTFDFGLAPIMIGLFFIGGLQLLFIGIIGEYLSSAIKRVTKRPLVIEKERINFEISDSSETLEVNKAK